MASRKDARDDIQVDLFLPQLTTLPMRDQRVQQNAGYLTIILLSRVITKLGDVKVINTRVIENLFTMDLAYLQDMYQRINMSEMPKYQVGCPHCGQNFEVPLDFLLG